MKHIDWKAAARASRLQTKLFEPVVSLNVLVALNASTSEQPWETSKPSPVRAWCDRGGIGGQLRSSERLLLWFGQQRHSHILGKIYKRALGGVTVTDHIGAGSFGHGGPIRVTSLPNVLKDERRSLPPGSTVVLVTSIMTDSLGREVREMKGQGYQVLILYAGDGQPAMEAPGTQTYVVGDALDVL